MLLPRVNLPGEQSVPIQTVGITTLRKFSLLPVIGQCDVYKAAPLTGSAARVFF